MERRFSTTAPTIETRADGGKKIVGYAAVFYRAGDEGTEYNLWGNYYERVAPTAFNAALDRQDDARALFNHDANQVLGRVGAGTLKLSVDDNGLRYEITPPETQQAKDIMALVERGDIPGSSFAFSVDGEKWEKDDKGKREIRTLTSVRLYDVGPVTYPAYGATTAGMRAIDGIDEARLSYQRHQELERYQEAARVKARMIEIDLTGDMNKA